MELNQSFNFNDPVEVTEIFRNAQFDDVDEDGKPIGKPVISEHAFKHYFTWEDIRSIRTFMFKDDWTKYPGPKYHIQLAGNDDLTLVLGNFDEMLQYWTLFRNTYPLFPKDEQSDNYGLD